MDDKENSNISFYIYGGNNQILPNATTATQNFYDGRVAQEKGDEAKDKDILLTSEAARLSVYINKVEDLGIYLAQIEACTGAAELAKIIVNMAEREPNITQELIVKEKFISLFLPLTPNFTSGKSIDNLRARINDAWSKRPRRRT